MSRERTVILFHFGAQKVIMQSGFVNMRDRLKFETARLHFGCDIAGMVLLLPLTNFSKF